MKLYKRILSLGCLLLALGMLASCGVTIHENLGSGDAINKSSGTIWYHASTCYEAVALEKKEGKLVITDQDSVELYKLPDMDPDEWLATEDMNVLYAEGTTLPTLSEMKPVALYFYLDGTAQHKLYELKSAETLTTIVKEFSENDPVIYPATTPYKTYRVRFASEEYPGLYYALTYVEYASDYVRDDVNYGKYFLYDRFDQRFVPVGDDIHNALGIESSPAS